jgi:pimeloyl-ACP methyl ester carboxylesterase
MPTIYTARGTLWFADYRANPAATPTLMIHGAGGSYLHFPLAMRHLPSANAVVPDLAAHGHNVGAPRTTVREHADDMIALLDALHIERAVILGHSMGGAIAQTLALEYPARVRGLVLIGTGAKLGVHPDLLNGLVGEMRAVSASVAETVTLWSWGSNADPRLRDDLGYGVLVSTPPPVLYADYSACNAFDIRARLADIHAPTLVIGGTADQMTPHKFSVYLRDTLPHAELVTIENGGHMMALEQPRAVTAAVAAWLARLAV